MLLVTPKCDCGHPQMVHAHVGCMAKGCECQHGVPATVDVLTAAGYPAVEIEEIPLRFVESWKRDNPEKNIEEYASLAPVEGDF